METTLRPLALGEILDRTAELYRNNFMLFAGISSVYAGILLVVSLIQIGAQEGARAMHIGGTTPIVIAVAAVVLLAPAIFVIGGLAVAATTRAVGWVHLGESASIGGSYRAILPKTWRYVWLMILTYFRAWFPFLLVYGAYFVLIFAYVRPKGLLTPHPGRTAPPDTQALLIFGGATVVFLVLGLAGFVYAIFMSLRYSLAVPACTVEGLKARAAIRRSIGLSKGSRGRIFVLLLLVVAVHFLLVGVTQGFFIVIGIKHHGVIPAGMRVAQQFLAFLTNTFVQPIYAIGFTLFYYDQRVRKEGYDIERMMQSAGMLQSEPASIASETAEPIPAASSGSVHE